MVQRTILLARPFPVGTTPITRAWRARGQLDAARNCLINAERQLRERSDAKVKY